MQAVMGGGNADAKEGAGGITMTGATVDANAKKQMFVLDKGQELRIEVENRGCLRVLCFACGFQGIFQCEWCPCWCERQEGHACLARDGSAVPNHESDLTD